MWALCSLLRCVRLDVCGTTQLVRGLCSSLIVLQTNASARPSARARSLVGFASDSGCGTVALWLLLLLHAEIVDMSTSVAERVVTVVVPIVVVQGQQLKQTALRPCHPCHIILAEKKHLKSSNEPQNIDTWLSRNRSLSLSLSLPLPPPLACLPSSQAVADTLTH